MIVQEIHIWRPSVRVFLKRAFLAGFISAAFLGPVFTFGPFLFAFDLSTSLIAAAGLVITILFWMFISDDWQNWNQHRHDEWRLTGDTLGYRNLDDTAEFATVHLSDVKSVSNRFWRGIKIKTKGGRAFQMSYLPNPKSVRTILRSRLETVQKGAVT